MTPKRQNGCRVSERKRHHRRIYQPAFHISIGGQSPFPRSPRRTKSRFTKNHTNPLMRLGEISMPFNVVDLRTNRNRIRIDRNPSKVRINCPRSTARLLFPDGILYGGSLSFRIIDNFGSPNNSLLIVFRDSGATRDASAHSLVL